MEYKIIQVITSYGGLDTNIEISYYIPSNDRFYLLSFTFDSVQQEILSKLKKEDVINDFIIRKHKLAKEYTYEEIKKFINNEVLINFIRDHKINDLLNS